MLKEEKNIKTTLDTVKKINPLKSPKDFSLYNCSGIVRSKSPICAKFAEVLEEFELSFNELMYKSILNTPDNVASEIRPVGFYEDDNNYWIYIHERNYFAWSAVVIRDYNRFLFAVSVDGKFIYHSYSMNKGEEIAYASEKTDKCISFTPAKGIVTGLRGFSHLAELRIVEAEEKNFDAKQIRKLLDNISSATQTIQELTAKLDKEQATK